jgi:high-affinity iron transporter
MFAGLLITIREGIEAFLIVGILLGYLTKMGQESLKRYVWGGTLVALALSTVLALAAQTLAVQFEGTNADVFEVVVALVAVVVLTWMVLWMQRQARTIRGELEHKVATAISRNQAYALAGLAFVSVLREGVETALFLSALIFTAGQQGLLLGALLGFLAALVIAYLVFRSAVRLNLRAFFVVTGLLLLFIAAGLVGHSVMGLQELNVLPGPIAPIWDTGWLISDDGLLGRLLHAFVGYEARPTLWQAVAYGLYLAVFGATFLRILNPTPAEGPDRT